MTELTGRQKVLKAITILGIRGYGPTLEEICACTGLKSKQTIVGHLETLKREGKVDWEPGKPRTIRVLA